MSFSQEWDERYRENTQLSIWPWSDMVSCVMRYARPNSAQFKVLELGCGAGANIPFFQYLGVQYYAIEGSSTIVERLWKRFPEFKGKIIAGDFTKNISFAEQFDLVVDRSSLTHNTTAAIRTCLSQVYDRLKNGGKYIGIDWFSIGHSDYQQGAIAEDVYTRKGYTEGQFANIGRVHFSDKPHLEELFANFVIERLEHKIVHREIPADKHVFASWNLVARKTET